MICAALLLTAILPVMPQRSDRQAEAAKRVVKGGVDDPTGGVCPGHWELGEWHEFNGHFYSVQQTANATKSWTNARLEAQALTGPNGEQVNLAAITSGAENDFIFNGVDCTQYWKTISSWTIGPNIGASNNGSPANDWQWVTGEPFTFANWEDTQPQDDRTALFGAIGSSRDSTWADVPDDPPHPQFHSEYYVAETLTGPPTGEPTLTVNKTADTNDGSCDVADCSLREAVATAATGDTIDFDPSVFGTPRTITLGSEILINKPLTINGPGADLLTISGNNAPINLFRVEGDFTAVIAVNMSGMTLTGSVYNSPQETVAAILAFYSRLTIEFVRVTSNAVGVYSLYGRNEGSQLEIMNSTIDNNTGFSAIATEQTPFRLYNSTVANNSGGGVYVSNSDTARILNSTITGNTRTFGGGGLHSTGSSGFSMVTTISSSIIAGNHGTTYPEIDYNFGQITSQGFNLIGDSAGDSTTTRFPINWLATDIRDTPPLLGTLADNGGTTPSMALLEGSPAIDKGRNIGPFTGVPFETDQRGPGFKRTRDHPPTNASDGTDIGAFEVQLNSCPGRWEVGDWFEFNGHFYSIRRTNGAKTWSQARTEAKNLTAPNGLSVDLAAITSAAENQFIADGINCLAYWRSVNNASVGPHIGAIQPDGSPEPDGNWRWVTREPFGFTSWHAGEPNNYNGLDTVAGFFSEPAGTTSQNWGDFPNDGIADIGDYHSEFYIAETTDYIVYKVGTIGNFTSLTNIGGFFQNLNNNPPTSDVVIEIVSDLTAETGANLLNQFPEPYTVTIIPFGGPRTISGTAGTAVGLGLIKLNGADRVTIDGSLYGGDDRSLTISNLGVTTGRTVIGVLSLGVGQGATNNTIKNTIVRCGANFSGSASTSFGIGAASITGAANGPDNDDLTIENNEILNCKTGMQIVGGETDGKLDDLVITGNVVGGEDTDFIGARGIVFGHTVNAAVTQNTVRNVVSTVDQVFGVGTSGTNSGLNFSQNTITNLSSSAALTVFAINVANVTNSTFSDNTISNVSSTASTVAGIGLTAAANSNFTGNTLTGFTSSGSVQGISVGANVTGSNFTKNRLSDFQASGTNTAIGFNVAITAADSNTTFANNFISDLRSQKDVYGININASAVGGVNIWHNSVNLFGSYDNGNTAALTTAFRVGAGTRTNIDLRNNIFVNTIDYSNQTDDANVAVFIANSSEFSNIDHNDYFVGSGPALASINGTNAANLAALQSLTGRDANSISADPLFVSATNLHVQEGSPVLSAGTSLAAVTDDIDGETRQTPPDIGADEMFTGPTSASTSVSGRVVTAAGVGIRNARISLVDLSGNTRTVMSNAFGYYRFDNVEVGQNYVLSVSAKQYEFVLPSRMIVVFEELSGQDFIAY